MPEFIDGGTKQVMPRTALALLGQFLRQYSQQHDLTLLSAAELPPKDDEASAWCLLGSDLSVLITACPQLDEGDRLCLSLTAEAKAVAAYLAKHSPPGVSYPTAAPTHLAALSDFMLAWVQVCAEASAEAEALVQVQLHRQRERRLLLNQVIAKIQGSLELTEILETTVAEMRRFLGADRLLIYQLNPRPPEAESPESETIGCITYESRSSDCLASVLNYAEGLCFQSNVSIADRPFRYRQGQPLTIDDVATAYQ
jgi:two-component system sensor histidine kinase/response regulator